jgi:hypothetical protein
MILEKATIDARVNVCVEIRDVRTGGLRRRTWKHNLVTTAGLRLVRDLLFGDGVTISHGAVGTEVTAPASNQTALGNEVYRDAISQRSKVEGPIYGTDAGLIVKFVVNSQSANGSTLREAGLFNAAAEGTMLARVTPEAIAMTEVILVIYTWGIGFDVRIAP